MQGVVLLPLFFLSLIAGQDSVGQKDFKITEALYKLGKYEIVIRQHKRLNLNEYFRQQQNTRVGPIFCSASIEIKENDQIIELERVVFDDIRGLGGRFGVFLPWKQESPKHFILLKCGDYDSRTIVVTYDGATFNLKGGRYRIFLNRFLVIHPELPDVDSGTFSIFDLDKNKVVLSVETPDLEGLPELLGADMYDFNFYTSGPEFFTGIVVYDPPSQVSKHTKYYYKIDLGTGAMTKALFDEKEHKEFVIGYSNIDMSNDCECKDKIIKLS